MGESDSDFVDTRHHLKKKVIFLLEHVHIAV